MMADRARGCREAWARMIRRLMEGPEELRGPLVGVEASTQGRPDNVALCLSKIINSSTDGEAELDQVIQPNTTIRALPPTLTGFPAWSRQEDYVAKDEDRDRGHADYVVPDGATNSTPRILYCHGGGYEFYSPQDIYRPHTSRLASDTGMPVLCIDYRLIPEFKHPAQLKDGMQGLRWLAKNGPHGPSQASKLFIAGDSAGGGLALALAVAARDAGDVKVDAVVAISPMTDLTCKGETYKTRCWAEGGGDTCDPIFRSTEVIQESIEQNYKLLGRPEEPGSYPLNEPSISVLHSPLHGLPPTQIHCGDAEVMQSDAVEFAKKARAAGSPVEVHVWPRMWHVFTQYCDGCGGEDAAPLDEAVKACAMITRFFKQNA